MGNSLIQCNNDESQLIYHISDNIPTKDGYTFVSWNTKPDGTGKTIQPGSTYNGKEGLTLYAQYEKIENNEDNEKDENNEKNPITGLSNNITICLVIIIIGIIGLILTKKKRYI